MLLIVREESAQVPLVRPHVDDGGSLCSLQSFAQLFSELHGVPMDTKAFASKLWGDVYYHSDTRGETRQTFKSKAEGWVSSEARRRP